MMLSDEIVVEELELSDDTLRVVADDVANALILAACKAVAHHAEPDDYPLPAEGRQPEHLFLARLERLSTPLREEIVERVLPIVRAPAEGRVRRFGALAGVEFRGAEAVLSQAHALVRADVVHPGAQDPVVRVRSRAVGEPRGGAGDASMSSDGSLQFRVHEITCLDEVDPELGTQRILAGGFVIDGAGESRPIATSGRGQLSADGVTTVFSPPSVFAQVELRPGAGWPRTFTAVIVMSEADRDGFPAFLRGLLDEASAALSLFLGANVAAGLGARVHGAALGHVIATLIRWLKAWWGDEFFPPAVLALRLPSASRPVSERFHFDSEARGGIYRVTFDLRLAHAAA